MSPGARIDLCGRLRIEIDGEPREEAIRGRQGRLLLAYLVLNRRRPVSRDELEEAIWADEGAPPSEGALSPVLSRLRRAVAPGTVEGREALSLVLPEPVWVDVEAVPDLLARARDACGTPDALGAAREAAALLEPGLLPGLEASWLEAQRRRVADLHLEALELVATCARGLDPALAESAARAVIAGAPFRESAWTLLVGALRAQGNVAEGLRAYDEIRTLLREELGAVPGPELAALHAELLAETDDAQPAPAPAPPAPAAPPGLEERESELAAVEEALGRVRAGAGSVVLFEGPAGIGKTRLLTELRRRASAGGARVLEARAGLLEREYAFGVVRQLFEDEAADELLEEAAGTFPVLRALVALVERLAADAPLVLCVDDLQWSDPASLRFAAYLARRVESVPVLLAATIRTGEPDADEALLAELAGEPVTVALRPRPLTLAATARVVAERLGAEPDGAFVAACQEVTGGNPLLVGQLLAALATDGVTPDAEHARAVRGIGPKAVGRAVLLRLSRMPAAAVAVARAVAVLGEGPGLPAIAGLAEVDEREAAAAIRLLTRAEILRAEEPLGFVHPLVRDAVYGELPAAAQALEHERAARVLAGLGASPERIAAQLLLAPPRADPWVVARLREAADVALRRGAPDAAMRLLERAQAEPPPADQQAELALELGGSAAYLRGPAGVEPLERAYAELVDPAARGRAAIRLSHLLLFVRSPQEGVEVADRAAADLPDELDDMRQALRSIRLIAAAFGAVDPAEFHRVEDIRRGPRGRGPGARSLIAVTALAVALTCGPAEEASALAREAFAGGLEQIDLAAPIALGSAALALGDPAEGLEAIAAYEQYATRGGEILSAIGAALWGGVAQIWAGDLPAAMESLERAHEGERLWGTKLDAVMAYSAAFTALARLERGDPLGEVRATLERVEAGDPRPDGARFWLASRAELALAEGRWEEAIEVTRRLEPTRPPDTHPVWAPWRSLRARALAALGERDEALRLARADLALAERIGAPWVRGRSLRLVAELAGADGVEEARAAVALLEDSSARLELAKAQLALAAALTAAGHADEAAGPRDAGRETARACGARSLAVSGAAAWSSTR